MLDYDKLLNVGCLKLENLDEDTLIDWFVIGLGKDDKGYQNWLCVEVWLDEGGKVQILEQNDYESEEITYKLTKEQKSHIYELVEYAIETYDK